MKKVSVIVPVYNVEKYIKKCLDSLVNQTLKDIEIIVVNDGSPDNSQSIIDDYVKKYPKKVKSYIKENGGQGSARNFGITKATGEYIGYVDSDDYVELDMYEKLYEKAISDGADIVMCANNIVYENSSKINLEKLFLRCKNDKVNALFNNPGVCNKIYKRKLLDDLSFRTKVWYEDIDYISEIIIKAKKISFIDEGLYFYLLRNGSTMNNNNILKNLDILTSFDSLISYLKDNNYFNKYKDEIEYLAIYHIYIAAVVRVINIKGYLNKNKIIKQLINYVNDNFPDYRKNKYLYLLGRNKKIIYYLIIIKQYWIVRLIFRLKGVLK